MKKFKYQKISKTKKLRYIDNYYKKNLYIVFLPGFMSDVEGQKPQSLKRYAIKKYIRKGNCLIFFKVRKFFAYALEKTLPSITIGLLSVIFIREKLIIENINHHKPAEEIAILDAIAASIPSISGPNWMRAKDRTSCNPPPR